MEIKSPYSMLVTTEVGDSVEWIESSIHPHARLGVLSNNCNNRNHLLSFSLSPENVASEAGSQGVVCKWTMDIVGV